MAMPNLRPYPLAIEARRRRFDAQALCISVLSCPTEGHGMPPIEPRRPPRAWHERCNGRESGESRNPLRDSPQGGSMMIRREAAPPVPCRSLQLRAWAGGAFCLG